MPGGSGDADAQVVAAVESGALEIAAVDRAAQNVADLAAKMLAGRALAPPAPDPDAHHRLAREVAARCVVLLRNDGELLPLRTGQSLAVIGEFAQTPRYQGGGSSHVNPTRLDVPLDEIRAAAEPGQVRYARGFATDTETADPALRAEAIAAAGAAEVAVVFLGLGAGQESEGFDREDIELPADQLALLADIVAVQPKTVV